MYRNFILENYANLLDEIEFIEIHREYVLVKNKTGEGKINISEINSIIEVQNQLYIKLSVGTALITPKNQVPNHLEIIKRYKELNIPYFNELNWKWI